MRSLAILLLLPAFCAAATTPTTRPAAVIVHIDRVTVNRDFDPATRAIPADAKRVDSIETLAQPGSDYRCATSANGITTELSGDLHVSTDGYYRLAIDFHRTLPDGCQQMTSSVMLKPGETLPISWCKAGNDFVGEVVFLTLQIPPAKK